MIKNDGFLLQAAAIIRKWDVELKEGLAHSV